MVVWVRIHHRIEFSAMRLFFRQSETGFGRLVSEPILVRDCWKIHVGLCCGLFSDRA